MQWRATQDLAAENYMMSMPPASYNPYWTGIQPGLEGFMPPYAGAAPYMGFGMGPLDMPFGGVLPQDPFAGQGCMLPFVPPQRYDSSFKTLLPLFPGGQGKSSFAPGHLYLT
jgi:E3 ubiquitin-protein ligase RBBP6